MLAIETEMFSVIGKVKSIDDLSINDLLYLNIEKMMEIENSDENTLFTTSSQGDLFTYEIYLKADDHGYGLKKRSQISFKSFISSTLYHSLILNKEMKIGLIAFKDQLLYYSFKNNSSIELKKHQQWKELQDNNVNVISKNNYLLAAGGKDIFLYEIKEESLRFLYQINPENLGLNKEDTINVVDVQFYSSSTILILDKLRGIFQYSLSERIVNQDQGIIGDSGIEKFKYRDNIIVAIQPFKQYSYLLEYYMTKQMFLLKSKKFVEGNIEKVFVSDELRFFVGNSHHYIQFRDQLMYDVDGYIISNFFLPGLQDVFFYNAATGDKLLVTLAKHEIEINHWKAEDAKILCSTDDESKLGKEFDIFATYGSLMCQTKDQFLKKQSNSIEPLISCLNTAKFKIKVSQVILNEKYKNVFWEVVAAIVTAMAVVLGTLVVCTMMYGQKKSHLSVRIKYLKDKLESA